MSNFACEYCGVICYDTPRGYVTGCEHYPADIDLTAEELEELTKKFPAPDSWEEEVWP